MGDGAEGAVVDLEDGVADVEVIVVLVPAHFGHQDRQVVLDAPLHAEPEPPVGVPLQAHVAKLKAHVNVYPNSKGEKVFQFQPLFSLVGVVNVIFHIGLASQKMALL